MNPDDGSFHELIADMKEKKAQLKKAVPEASLEAGDQVPKDWPIFEIGELIPIKGHHFKLVRIHTDDNSLVLKHHGMTKAEKRRRKK